MKKLVLTISIFAFIAINAKAQGPSTLSHSYIDVGFERSFYSGDLGGNLEDANGIAGELSIAPTEHFFLLAEYHYANPDTIVGKGSVDTQDLRLALGANTLIAGGGADIYIQTGLRYLELGSVGAFERVDDWGFYIEPGIRVAIGPSLEVYLSGDYTRIDERNLWGGEIGTVIKFTDMLGLEFSGRLEENRGILVVGARVQW
ncbi:MAG: outer membrane beta-barrel protein [Verrucomicrobia bacterium]|nr:outer membrane beta-barrel protein [Verrucomicrobiota bacterium]